MGSALRLIGTDPSGDRRVRGRVWLDTDAGQVRTDVPALIALWRRQGIVGRSDRGRLFPHHGQDFLDELPFVYRSPYLMAVPERLADGPGDGAGIEIGSVGGPVEAPAKGADR